MPVILYGALIVGAIVCAFIALQVSRLLTAALWLAVSSALLALLFYVMGAPEIGVIELSVGAGLVTVLFVFAISIAGNEPRALSQILPRPVAWLLALAAFGLLAWQIIISQGTAIATQPGAFSEMLWQQRGLDVLAQIALIYCGVLGFLGLLSGGPSKAPTAPSPAEEKHA